MHEFWFGVVSFMIAIYAVMDGFDFGAGSLHLIVAKTNEERREVLGAIGPLWDGNEVWLIAAAGALFMAFPKVLAAGFSGFYLALFLVLWTLILRGISIEFRSHVEDRLWRTFWDGSFAVSSILLPILLGMALGNVIRGVPLDLQGNFNIPLFTTFGTGNPVGILDWYTLLVGVFAWVVLTAHGALFLAWKLEGPVQARCLRMAMPLWILTLALWLATTLATKAVNPAIFEAFSKTTPAWLFFVVYVAGLGLIFLGLSRRWPLLAFLGSCAFVLGILATTATCVFPVMLRSTLDPAWSLTAFNASVEAQGLRAGLAWWLIGFPLVVAYFAYLFYLHRGKVKAAPEGEGY
jgi:cytochrome d ubiquinol oxidase subunit II